jgi:hypothetical protein
MRVALVERSELKENGGFVFLSDPVCDPELNVG